MKLTIEIPDSLATKDIDLAAVISADIAKRGESIVHRAKMDAARAPVLALREQMKAAKPEERVKLQGEMRAAMEAERTARRGVIAERQVAVAAARVERAQDRVRPSEGRATP